jgi:hypothetical protein
LTAKSNLITVALASGPLYSSLPLIYLLILSKYSADKITFFLIQLYLASLEVHCQSMLQNATCFYFFFHGKTANLEEVYQTIVATKLKMIFRITF